MRATAGVIAAALLTAAGCAAPISTDVRVTDPAPRELRVRELAILPLTTDPGLESEAVQVAQLVHDAIRAQYPSLSVVAPALTLERLQNADLATAYANLVGEYEQSGVLNATLVGDMGAAIGAEHLLHVRLLQGETAGYAPVQMPGRDRYEGQGLRLVAQIWDGRTGAMLWRSVADVSAISSDLLQQRGASDLIAELVPELAARLPVEGGDEMAATPEWNGPSDRNVFFGASGLLFIAFLLL